MRSSLSILVRTGAAALLVWTPAYFCCCYLSSSSTPKSIAFKNAAEFKDFALCNGFFFHSGNVNGVVGGNYFIADHLVTLNDVEEVLTRRDCGLTPAWRGILWVCQIHDTPWFTALATDHVDGKRRVWGNVLVAGDEDLMDRIEELYANNK